MTPPIAVVFDLDGTLTDTERTWAEVRRALTLAAGHEYPDRATVDMMGMSTTEWARYCSEQLGHPGTLEEVAARVIDAVAAAYHRGEVTLLPDAAASVRRMAARGPVAVASSSPPVLIEAGLSALGVAGLVPVRVSSEAVGVGKPAPDVYLEACRRLGVPPADAAAVEDSTAGVRSALAAGMRVVAVPHPDHAVAPDALAAAAAVLGSLAELDEALLARLGA